jgi:Na+-driven multidrug efflux pump
MKVSVPAYLEKIIYNGGYLLFVIVIARLGKAAMAANQAMVSIEAICFLSAEGFAIAAASLVASKLGARKKDEASDVAIIATRMSILLLTACGILFAVFPRVLMRAFTSDPEIISMGASALHVTAIAQPFMAYAIVIRMSLRGAGSTATVLYINLVGTFFVRLPLAYLAITQWGWSLTGIWIASTADWVVQAALALVVFRRGTWREQRV